MSVSSRQNHVPKRAEAPSKKNQKQKPKRPQPRQVKGSTSTNPTLIGRGTNSYSRQRDLARAATSFDDLQRRRNVQSRGEDARDPTLTTNVLPFGGDATQEMVIRSSIPVQFSALSGPAIAILSVAYQQGFQSSCDEDQKPWAPYAAFLFICKILEKAVLGQNSNLTEGPQWLKYLYDSLYPHKVPFKTGEVAYSWTYQANPANYIPIQAMAPYSVTPARNYAFLYPVNGPSVDGWDVLGGNTVNPTSDQELAAFNMLCTYMSSRPGISQAMWANTAFTKPSEFARNASAFAYASTQFGSGQGGTGFWSGVVYNEVPITHPLFSCFAGKSTVNRGFRQFRLTAGDSIYLGYRLASAQSALELRTKNPLVAKPIDFYYLASLYFSILAASFQQYYNDNASASTNKFVNFGMSIQDALILFRQSMMDVFASTQTGVQGIVYRTEHTNTVQPFRPFIVGPGTAGLSNCPLQGPLMLVENIRLLQGRRVVPSINPRTGKIDKGSPQYILPCIGGQPGLKLNYQDFTYTDGSGNVVPIFDDYPAEYIELITGESNANRLALNTSPKLQGLLTRFEEVYATLSRYIARSAVFDPQPGINAFEMITMTRMLQADLELTHPHPVYRSGSITRYATKIRTGEDKGYVSMSSMQPFVKTIYESLQEWWVAPEYQIYPLELPSGVVTSQTVRSTDIEPYNKHLAAPTQDTMFALSRKDLIQRFVSEVVAPWGTKDNEATKLLVSLSEKGEGSFASDLADAFSGTAKVLGPVAGGFVGGVIRGTMGAGLVGRPTGD